MYYFVVNPNSRSGGGKRIWEEIQAILSQRQIPYKGYLTRYCGHAEELARAISAKGTRENPVHLIALGGDGTIHEILSGITDPEAVIFGFIPTGSGNDFCRSMQIPQNPLEALDTVLKEEYITDLDIPYIELRDRRVCFGISTGIGYDAAVCQEAIASPAKKALNRIGLGKLVYLVIALKQLIFTEPVRATVTLDRTRSYHFRKMYFSAVMNQPYEGGGFCFCPRARHDDGVLDVIVCDSLPRPLILLCLPLAFFGKHTRVPGIHIYRCKTAEIRTQKPCAIHVDGESKGVRCRLTAGIGKKKLRMIV